MGSRFGGLAVVLGSLCWNGFEWVFVLEVLLLCLDFCVGTDLSGFSFWMVLLLCLGFCEVASSPLGCGVTQTSEKRAKAAGRFR